jgi:hypothetical protein
MNTTNTKTLRRIFWLAAILLAALHTWAARHAMNPDGISYLDLADAFRHHDWNTAFSLYWSPLYSIVMAGGFWLLNPSPYWEFPVAHFVNFVIFLFALICFEFLLREVVRFSVSQRRLEPRTSATIERLWYIFAYPLFIWSSLYMTTMNLVTPDLLVAALTYLSSGLLLRMRTKPEGWLTYVALGAVLGIAYWAKAVMLLVAMVFLGITFLQSRPWRRLALRAALAFIAFILVASPLLWRLSTLKGRLTFGETGRVNYAWKVNGIDYPYWDGGPPGIGVPRHPPRKIFTNPVVHEFATPFRTTYPVWTAPAYWYEGVTPRFQFKPQLVRLVTSLSVVRDILLSNVSCVLAVGIIALYGFSSNRRLFFPEVRKLWGFLLVACTVFALTLPITADWRFFAAPVVLLWITLYFAAIAIQQNDASRVSPVLLSVAIVIALIMMTSTMSQEAFTTAREVRRGENVAGNPNWDVAEGLKNIGVEPGDAVANVGNSFYAYWARLAHVRIVADIERPMDFWSADESVRRQVIDAITKTGAKVLVSEKPLTGFDDRGWVKISADGYYAYPLPPSK